MKNNTITNAAIAAAFSLPAGAAGREALVRCATRLRAGGWCRLEPAELLVAVTRCRYNHFVAQKAAKVSPSKGEKRSRKLACSRSGPKGRSY